MTIDEEEKKSNQAQTLANTIPPIGKLDQFSKIVVIFKALALWADAFYKSKCPSACPSVRLSVCPCVHF